MQVQSLFPEDPWSRERQVTPAFLPGKFHGQRCCVLSPWGHNELDMTGHSYYMGHLLEERTKTQEENGWSWPQGCSNQRIECSQALTSSHITSVISWSLISV